MAFEAVIGLEIHVQLKTKSKMFCACGNYAVDAEPNALTCPLCMGMPGTLPVINRQAVEWTVMTGLALGCEINQNVGFDRKHYFYPDLPKGYQISQYKFPIVGRGVFKLKIGDKLKDIRINRIHLEEDAGKLVHEGSSSLVDLNRAGTPLMELVTEPDFSSALEARVFLQELRKILRYLDVSNADMEQGNLRCDANVSVRKVGEQELGTKAEIKNMNSFKFLEEALSYEIERQQEVLASGGAVVQETRMYIESKKTTESMRVKEGSEDYRYFPDPDLPPLDFGKLAGFDLEQVKSELPELPMVKKERYMQELGLSLGEAETLSSNKDLAHYFETVVSELGNEVAQKAANWVLGTVLEFLNKEWLEIKDCKVSAVSLAGLIKKVGDGSLNNRMAKEVFAEMFATGKTVEAVVAEKGMGQVSSEEELALVIDKVIAANAGTVEQYKSGKKEVFGFFVGQVMKDTQGRANPAIVNKLLQEKLGA